MIVVVRPGTIRVRMLDGIDDPAICEAVRAFIEHQYKEGTLYEWAEEYLSDEMLESCWSAGAFVDIENDDYGDLKDALVPALRDYESIFEIWEEIPVELMLLQNEEGYEVLTKRQEPITGIRDDDAETAILRAYFARCYP